MAVTVWPANTEDYTAQEWRQVQSVTIGGATTARPLGARSGVRPGTPTSTVALDSATVWRVKPHAGVLDLATSATSGPYFYAVDADVTGAVTAAEAIIRKDILWVRLDDPATGDGSSVPAAVIGYTKGTVASTPPSTPARAMRIATITVPVSGGGSPTIVWDPPYAVAAGGVIPVRSTAERDALSSSATSENPIYADLGGVIQRNVGSGWVVVNARHDWTGGKDGPMPSSSQPIEKLHKVGTTALGSGGTLAVVFPSPFPTSCAAVFLTGASGSGVAPVINGDTISAAGFTVAYPGVAAGTVVTFYYLAKGW